MQHRAFTRWGIGPSHLPWWALRVLYAMWSRGLHFACQVIRNVTKSHQPTRLCYQVPNELLLQLEWLFVFAVQRSTIESTPLHVEVVEVISGPEQLLLHGTRKKTPLKRQTVSAFITQLSDGYTFHERGMKSLKKSWQNLAHANAHVQSFWTLSSSASQWMKSENFPWVQRNSAPIICRKEMLDACVC